MTDRFARTYAELSSLGLDRSPFVLVAVIGQELLMDGHVHDAITMLQHALTIGSSSLKLRQSVLSSLSNAYARVGQLDRATECMRQDLDVATSLGRPHVAHNRAPICYTQVTMWARCAHIPIWEWYLHAPATRCGRYSTTDRHTRSP
jgi:lipopolysaccharide biosynthesis regulator YciM